MNINNPINLQILSIAEDRIQGFHRRPFHSIAEATGLAPELVQDRLRAMVSTGVVRRVRQTMLATKLADGALIAWKLPEENIEKAFEWFTKNDPFTGHVVLRHAGDANAPGADYRLWTTLKVPIGSNSLEGHCDILKSKIGAESYVLLPAKGVFALGVGHIRRRGLQVGDKMPEPAEMQTTHKVHLSDEEWLVLLSLKEELSLEEFIDEPWAVRAQALGMSHDRFCEIATHLNEKKVVGRFATFLEHVKHQAADGPVTKFNGLFHWAVPEGMEQRAGAECGRHRCMTHCYWRTGGAVFGGAQIMGVVHGLERDMVLAHKASIDAHLEACGIPVLHTAVFWGERSEIKPSEISPAVYAQYFAPRGEFFTRES